MLVPTILFLYKMSEDFVRKSNQRMQRGDLSAVP